MTPLDKTSAGSAEAIGNHISQHLAELALVERENAAVPGRHALDVHAIAHVVRAWADCESDTWSGGFVLELNDGSRMYLEGFESDGWGPHSAASVVPMPADNNLPNLSSNHCANLFGWREDAPEFAQYLRRVDEDEKTTRASSDLHDFP
jgi:hypothetical protein